MCTNCTKYNKVCEYGPPVKAPKPPKNPPPQALYDINGNQHIPGMAHPQPHNAPPNGMNVGMLYTGEPPSSFDFIGQGIPDPGPMNSMPLPNMPPANLGDDLNGMNSFSANLSTPSPFVADQAQPVIGMPPYVPSTGPEVYYDPTMWVQTSSDGVPQQVFDISQMSGAPEPMQAQFQSPMEPQGSQQAQQTQSFASSMNTDYQQPIFESPAPSAQSRQQSVLTTSSAGSRVGSAANYITTVSDPPTPDGLGAVSGSTPNSEDNASGTERPKASRMYRQTASIYVADAGTNVDGLTERLGEFLFSPNSSAVKDDEQIRRRKKGSGSVLLKPDGTSVKRMRAEYDGLLDSFRSILLDCFLAHVTLFFEMSVPRFRYRMTFADRRRPSLALLNTMYLWATRISNAPQMSNMEKQFFEQACTHLDISTSTVDRLIDGVRAAMLLSAYSYASGRHHEGWCLGGLAVRVAVSCGLHRISSMTLRPPPPRNPFLRNQHFLLPPPEDAVELGERIHAFWAAFSIDRAGALATGYPSGMHDEDIKTPFHRPLADISAGMVSEIDDITVKDLFLGNVGDTARDNHYIRWLKVVIMLERASKLAYLDPDDDSPYAQAWNKYHLTLHRDPDQPKPPAYLDQSKYRNPGRFRGCLLAIEQFTNLLGEDGVFPVTRRAHADQDGQPEPEITPATLMLHHLIAAVHMVLHDINSLEVENTEAVMAARRSVTLFRAVPPIPFTEVDAFVVLVWSMIAKVLIKEAHRLTLVGDSENARITAADADTVIAEIRRIALTMHLARTQANALDELKQAALSAGAQAGISSMSLEQFMFPTPM